MIKTIRRNARGSARLCSAWALLLACGSPADEGGESPEDPAAPAQGTNAAALTRATSCEDVLAGIQSNTIARLMERAEQLRIAPENYYGEPGIIVDGPVAEGPGNPLPGGAPTPTAPGDPSAPVEGDSAGGGGSGSGFSDTTVQVEDVDEADIVKADGNDLYVLQGSYLVKLRAWPARDTQTLAMVVIEGQPLDMFVNDGKAVVFSSVSRDLDPPNPSRPYDSYYPYYYPNFTKVTVLDVSRETPEILRESYLEGYYVSSRRHDSVVRAVIADNQKVPSLEGVYIEYFTPFGEPYRQEDIDAQVDAWLERTIWAVTETELGDWLPRQFTAVGGQVTEQLPDCRDYYQPSVDLAQSGVTQIFSLDVDDDDGVSPLAAATVLARAERVYANSDVVLLAQTDYGSVETNYSESTNLHRFNLDGVRTEYAASGSLPGFIQSQFSLDEHDGVIRASTTENRWSSDQGDFSGPKNRVFTLSTDRGSLDVLGQTEVFGQNEQIFATRFIGDLGYVVTFRQVDPLFVVDLRDPASPAVVGELHIPGFSNFLYPLDSDHLFSIGRDATEEGFTQGLALQIFDVSDPSAPGLTHKYVYSNNGYSDANVDHRAITFHPEGGRVAFPLTDYQTGSSTLEVFDVDADNGFVRRGGVVPSLADYTLAECVVLLGYGEDALDGWLGDEIAAWPEYADSLLAQCRGYEQVRRGVLRADYAYAISTRSVYVQHVNDLGTAPTIRADLPEGYYGGYYPGFPGGFAGAAGAAGAGGSWGAAGAAGAAGAGGFGGEGGSASAGAAGAAGAGGFGGEAGSASAGAAGAAGAGGFGGEGGSASAGAAGAAGAGGAPSD